MARRSTTLIKVCVATSLGMVLGVTAFDSAVSAATVLEDFEEPDDSEGEYPLNWVVIQERIDLGQTTLAGCTSYDGASYSNLDDIVDFGRLFGPQGSEVPSFGTAGDFNNLADRHSEYGYYVKWFAPGESSQYQVGGPGGPLVWWDAFWGGYGFGPDSVVEPVDFSQLTDPEKEELLDLQATTFRDDPESPIRDQYEDEYDVTVLDGTGYGIGWNSQVLQLYNWSDSYSGHVIHGPAVVSSDTLTVTGAAQLSFWFSASADMDYYHVFGYLQRVDDSCASVPIVIFNDSGKSSPWREITVNNIPAGEYKFVFVSGTYDYTWGQLGGALLWIDDIACDGQVTANGDSCALSPCLSNCTPAPTGLGVDEIELLPSEVSFPVPGSLAGAVTQTPQEELPQTGSGADALSLSAALLTLGMCMLAVSRRRRVTPSSGR